LSARSFYALFQVQVLIVMCRKDCTAAAAAAAAYDDSSQRY